jgi:ribonucleotide monophosphatase NagD (HAD superfamily)
VGTAYLAALYLKELKYEGKAYVIGTAGITGELKKVGIESLPIGVCIICLVINDLYVKKTRCRDNK